MEYFGPFAGRACRLHCAEAREELKSGYPDQEPKNPRKRTDSCGALDSRGTIETIADDDGKKKR